MTQKSTAWYVHYPNDAYALGPLRFQVPLTPQEVRAYLRDFMAVARLPQGLEIWPA